MGMGEPMMNLDSVLGACERLPDLGITHRRTAISTVGWIPGIERLDRVRTAAAPGAVAARAPTTRCAREMMPVNERYPLRDVLDACRAFYARRGAGCSSST